MLKYPETFEGNSCCGVTIGLTSSRGSQGVGGVPPQSDFSATATAAAHGGGTVWLRNIVGTGIFDGKCVGELRTFVAVTSGRVCSVLAFTAGSSAAQVTDGVRFSSTRLSQLSPVRSFIPAGSRFAAFTRGVHCGTEMILLRRQ